MNRARRAAVVARVLMLGVAVGVLVLGVVRGALRQGALHESPQATAPPLDPDGMTSPASAASAPSVDIPEPPSARTPDTNAARALSALSPSDETRLMARLRAVRDTDPALALELARDGNRRFPDSADAPERASIAIHALATQGRPSEAREAAEEMVNHYPDSPWVRDVERLTGAHRHRNLRLNAQGQLESY